MKIRSILIGVGVAIGLALVASVPAHAEESPTPPPYVLAAWQINTPDFDGVTITDVWGGGGQNLAESRGTASTDLTALQSAMPCGSGWYQFDLYNYSETTRVLLLAGILTGPSQPNAEDFATGVSPQWIAYWQAPECPAQPQPRAYANQWSDFTCDLVTDHIQEGAYLTQLIDNVWVEDANPTLTVDTATTRVPSQEEKDGRGCTTEVTTTTTTVDRSDVLADTGEPKVGWKQLLPWALGLGLLAALLFWLNNKNRVTPAT